MRNEGKKVACFGEAMLRLSPDAGNNWIQAAQLPAYIGGAELNVASALAHWNCPARFITAWPANPIGAAFHSAVGDRGVEVKALQLPDTRMGLYYLMQGAELKGSGVTYDRKGSAFSTLSPGMINWQAALEDCHWFHCSAITPGLNAGTAAIAREGMQAAKQKGITVSIDLNYRPLLWKYGTPPEAIMPSLLNEADIVMGNIWAVESLLGIPAGISTSAGSSSEALVEAALTNGKKLMAQFPDLRKVYYTFRLESSYFAVAITPDTYFVSNQRGIPLILDRAGSGDCFMAALIYAELNGFSYPQQLALAVSAAVHKMGERGDHTQSEINSLQIEAEQLLAKTGSQ